MSSHTARGALAFTALTCALALAAPPAKAPPKQKPKAAPDAGTAAANAAPSPMIPQQMPPEIQAEIDKLGFDAGQYFPPYKAFQWDVPKVLSEIDVPDTFETNGIPNRFHVVEIGLPLAEAYDHFYRSFTAQGLWVPPTSEQMELGEGQLSLSGFDPISETSYTVLLAPLDKARTHVIMGESYWKDRTYAPGNAFAPVMPGAQSVVTQNLETGQSLSYRVKATRDEVEAFYQGALKQQGYEQQKDGIWTRGDESLHVVWNPANAAPGFIDVAMVKLRTP